VRTLALLVAATAAAGCGAADRKVARVKSPQTHRSCLATSVFGFRTCSSAKPPANPTIERRTASGWKVVTGPLRPPDPAAEWGEVSLSADGRTLLAEYQYPCDSAAVVFVSAEGGVPRLVTGEADWRKAPVAHALGWTRDGRARVRIYRRWRSHRINPRHPRVFLFDPRIRLADPRPAAPSGC